MKERVSSVPNVGGEVKEQSESPDLGRLESMSREALISLVQRMARQCGMVAAMTKEETAQAMLDTLAHTALKPTEGIQSRMAAIDKWLDRERGKPNQAVTLTEKKTIQLIIELGGQANEILTIDNDANELCNAGDDSA